MSKCVPFFLICSYGVFDIFACVEVLLSNFVITKTLKRGMFDSSSFNITQHGATNYHTNNNSNIYGVTSHVAVNL